jgi:Tol biopolymer transport system component
MATGHRRLARRARLLALAGSTFAALQGCGQGEDPAGLTAAVLRIVTATTGPPPPPYTLAIDGSGPTSIGPADTLIRSGVASGEHTVELGGVPSACAVDSGAFRTVSASEGDTTALTFRVSCPSPPATPTGALVVTTATTGVDQDPDGYLLGMDPSESRVIGINESIRLEGVPAGAHSVRLSGLAGNCSSQDQNPRSVEIPTDGEASVGFAVRCWPPAAGTIAFMTAGEIDQPGRVMLMDLNGTVVGQVLTPGFPEFEDWPSWSPTGEFLAYVAGPSEFESTVFVHDLRASAAIALPGCFPTGPRPQWSPDGSRLLCLSQPRLGGGALTSVRRDGGDVRSLSPDSVAVATASFLPDGSVVYTTEQFIGFGAVEFRVGAAGGTPVPLFELPENLFLFTEVPMVAVSPDGSRMTYFAEDGLHVITLDGQEDHLVSADLNVDDSGPPAWSPDGTRLAFLGISADLRAIWLVAPDGSGLTHLPLPGSPDFRSSATWSPDGTRLVVGASDADTDSRLSTIYVIRTDGSGLQQLSGGDGYDTHPVWKP